MKSFNWVCPFCNHAATITSSNYSDDTHFFHADNKDGALGIYSQVIVCPNESCKEYAITIALRHASKDEYARNRLTGAPLITHAIRPQSNAKVFPSYIPKPIISDYEEACLILKLSPKASATLSRRCIQGIIRDFWNIQKGTLYEEINELKGKVDDKTWDAIDAVRSIGNIGAHMEKDINLVIDVESEEAELLIGLIEFMLKDCYIARHERDKHLSEIVRISQQKKMIAKGE